MKQGKVNRWDLPGWKFEPSYSARTLVGDWFEERKMFPRGNMSFVTSNVAEYTACDCDFKTRDWRSMWNNRIVQQSGFGIKYLLDHHSNDYVTQRLSTYNLEFSSPFRMETIKYQPRRWDSNIQRWVPEKMDLPISKNKTLYDTIQKMKFRSSSAYESSSLSIMNKSSRCCNEREKQKRESIRFSNFTRFVVKSTEIVLQTPRQTKLTKY